MSLRKAAWIAAGAAVAALVVWAALRPTRVEVAEVRRGDLVATLSATGVVEAYQAEVAPAMLGRVSEVLVEEGDVVREGQMLARLEATKERAAVREREAALEGARAEVARLSAALEQERALSRARIEGAKAGLGAARARLRELEAGARAQEVERARQRVAAARAEAELAAADHERMSKLRAEGAVSQAQADAARTRRESAEAGLRAAEQELALVEEGAREEQVAAARAGAAAAEAELAGARAAAGQVAVLEWSVEAARAGAAQAQAAVTAAERGLAETEVVAPMSGAVGRRFVDVGDLVSPGSPLFVIADSKETWVTAEVDEEDLALVHRGQKVEVTAEALGRPLAGEVVEVGAVAIPRGLEQVRAKIVRSRVRLTEGGRLLRPGMEVDVKATATLARGVLLMPLEGLVEAQEGELAFAVREGRARRQKITTGRRSYREVEVLSGLREGDEVVVSGSGELKDGQRVAAGRG